MEAGRSVVYNSDIYFAPFEEIHIHKFISLEEQWTTIEMPMKWMNSGLAIIEGQVATVGGQRENMKTNEVWAWSNNREWERLPPMKEVRSDPGVVSQNNYVIVISGEGEKRVQFNWIRDVEVYDVKEKSWSKVCPLKSQPIALEVTLCNDIVYVLPELELAMKCNLNELIRSSADEKESVWREISQCPLKHSTPATIDDHVVCIGGEPKDDLKDIFVYKKELNLWYPIGHLPKRRMYPMVEVCDNRIFVVGGIHELTDNRPSSNRLETVEVYTLNI